MFTVHCDVKMLLQVTMRVFRAWLSSCGVVPVTSTVMFYLLYIVAQIATNIWLSAWSSDVPASSGSQDVSQRNVRLGVYGGLGGVQGESWKIMLYNLFKS